MPFTGHRRLTALVLLMLAFSGCGFGVGAFRSKDRSGLFRSEDQRGVAEGYERVQREGWTDVGEEFGVSIGFKPQLVFGPPPKSGDFGVGYGFDAHLNLRWRMLELTGGYASEALAFDDESRFSSGAGVVGLNYYFPLSPGAFYAFLGAAFQMGSVTFTPVGGREVEVDDVLGGRGSAGLAFILPELIFNADLMLRLEGGFTGTQRVMALPQPASFLAGRAAVEALLFF